MEKFRSRFACKFVVVVEMTLAGLSIFLAVGFFFARIAEPGTEEEGLLHLSRPTPKPPQTSDVLYYMVQVLEFNHFVLLVLVFFAGQRVLSEACSLNPQVMDLNRITYGETACDFFCILELVRLLLVLVGFFGQLLLLNVAVALQLIGIVVNLPIIFGWFFTSEFGKELKTHGDDLKSTRDLFPIPPSISFTHWQRQHQNSFRNNGNGTTTDPEEGNGRENQDTADAMMYSAPSIAYCINNLMR